MNSSKTPAFSIFALMMLAGCTVGPDYAAPESKAPAAWASDLEKGVRAEPVALAGWWKQLKDPTLDGLIDRAITGNLDLREARARVVEARAQRGVAASEGLPQVEASGLYSRSRSSENRGFGGGGAGGGGDSSFGEDTAGRDLYQAGFDASWELDVFGGIRRGVEAADAEIEAAEEGRRDVLVTLLSEVARNYVEVRAFQSRLDLAVKNVRVQRETVEVTKARNKAGLTSELDSTRAESNLAATESAIPPLQAGLRSSIYRLSVLLGKNPGELTGELATAAPMPACPGDVPIGLPSELLRRRPDIRRAERELAASTARIGVATADLFPRFSLTGSFGVATDQVGTIADGDSRFWSIGPAVRWPILQGGRIRSNIAVQNARQEQAAARYEKAVLTGFEETENALVNLAREQDRREKLRAAVEANLKAVDISNQLYSRGLTDFQAVLDSQRDLFQSQDQLVASDRSVTQNLIALYKALGGGWEGIEGPELSRYDDAGAGRGR